MEKIENKPKPLGAGSIILLLIIGFVLFKCYSAYSEEGDKWEFTKKYYDGDVNKFDTDLEQVYSGDFERMKKAREEVIAEIEKYNSSSVDSSSKKSSVIGKAKIHVSDKELGYVTVWSVPGTTGRKIGTLKENEDVSILSPENYKTLSDYDYVFIESKDKSTVGFVYKYALKLE